MLKGCFHFNEELLLICANFMFLTWHFFISQTYVSKNISHYKHNELANAAVNRVTMWITHNLSSKMFYKAFKSSHCLSWHFLEIHFFNNFLEIRVKFFNIIFYSFWGFNEELLIRCMENIRPSSPLVNLSEFLLCKVKQLKSAYNPLIF